MKPQDQHLDENVKGAKLHNRVHDNGHWMAMGETKVQGSTHTHTQRKTMHVRTCMHARTHARAVTHTERDVMRSNTYRYKGKAASLNRTNRTADNVVSCGLFEHILNK